MWGRVFRYAWLRIRRETSVQVAVATVLLLIVCAAFPGLLAKHSFQDVQLDRMLSGPSRTNPFGTDQLGRDILSRVVYGSRIVIYIMLVTNLLSLTSAVLLGLLAGFYAGIVNQVIMRITDVILAFPSLLLALALINILGAGLNNSIVAIGISLMGPYIRMVCGQVLTIRAMLYVEGARALGVGTWRIMRVYILPNIWSPIIVQATLGTASSILGVAALSFLGLGAQPPTPDWGAMVYEGRVYLQINPLPVLVPAGAIFLVSLSLNTLGELLRDVLEPRLLTLQTF